MANAHGGVNGWYAVPDGLRALLARADNGVWVTTAEGRIVFWNRAAEAILGFRASDVCGRSCAELLTGRDEQGRPVCGPGCDAGAGANKIGQSFGVPTRAKNGRDVWLEVLTCATTPDDASAALVIHIFHDATATKKLLRELGEHLGEAADGAAPLTRREREVLHLMVGGHGTAATAARLRVSRATVRNHVQNIFAKLGVHTRLEAVAHATRRQLL